MNARAPVIVLFHSPVVGEQAHKIRVFAQRWAQQGAEYGVNITVYEQTVERLLGRVLVRSVD